MRKRIYHMFPHQEEHFEKKYRYQRNLPYFAKILANMDGKSGVFVTESPVKNGHMIHAKREIEVGIVVNGVDFEPLNLENADQIIGTIEPEGTIDFRIALKYSYLDEKYDRISFRGDAYLVRACQESDVLTLLINHVSGIKRTDCDRVADTIIDELRRGV